MNHPPADRSRRPRALPVLLTLVLGMLFTGCGTTYDRRDPTGEVFPSVQGTALDETPVRIPEEFAGSPVVLLVGYKQNSQFDIDRWLLGLAETGTEVAVRELPTLPGLLPGMFSGWIDGGMRRGIPSEDWFSVVTVYGDADAIARFTGNRDGLPGRVLLLDSEGRVAFFHDRGFSPSTLQRLREVLSGLSPRTR